MAGGGSSSWYKWVLLASAYVALFMVFIGEKYLIRMVEAESTMNKSFYSEGIAQKAADRGSRWFEATFVDTQIMAHSFEPFIPTEEEMAKAKGMEGFAEPVFHWFEGRIRAWWTLVWTSFTRLSTILLWAPYGVLMIAPWVVDGYVQREKSKHTFEFSSPVKHRYALVGLMMMPLVFILVVTAPVAMHPLVTPALLFGVGIMVYQAFASFMKRA